MSTDLQKSALRLQKRVFFYLEHQPFHWESDFLGISFTNSRRNWIPWILGQLHLTIYALTCFYVAATHYWINSRLNFNSTMLIIFLLMGCGIFLSQIIACVCLFDRYLFIQSINEMLNFERNLIRMKKLRNKKCRKEFSKNFCKQQRVLDMLLVVIVAAAGIGSLNIPIVCLFVDFDAYYFAFQDLLPDPEYQSAMQIILHIFVRLFLLTHVAAESIRLIVFMATGFLIYLQCIRNILEHFRVNLNSAYYFRQRYVQFYLIFNLIQNRLNQLLYFCISIVFWATVVVLYVATKGCGLIDTIIYLWIVLGSILIVGASIWGLQLCTGIYMSSRNLLKEVKFELFVKMGFRRTRQLKLELRETTNLKFVKLKFGNIFDIDSSAAASFLMNLTDNWASAVLLF